MVLSETIRFFADYLIPGSTLQHYDIQTKPRLLFFMIFGYGTTEADQLPLLPTNLRYYYLAIGTLTAGAVLLAVYEKKSKYKKDGNALFDDYKFEKLPPKNYFKNVFNTFKSELTVWEYILWWVLRGLMVWAAVKKYREDPSDFVVVILCINLAVTFLVPLLRIFGFLKLFFGKLHLRLQSYINLLIFFCSFLHHGCDLGNTVKDYDKYLHMLTGWLCVLIGYEIIKSTRRGESLSPGVYALASGGFSCMVSAAWEIFEFFSDYYIQGSRNQDLSYHLENNNIFVHIFGSGAGNPGHIAVFDTTMDIICNLCFCLAAMLLLYAVLKVRYSVAVKKNTAVTEKKRT
ncbi:MAG: hypothetical protein K5756_00520 [Clostridiales bacterium]|nr:hypothetical protein [Clostridiales bacterium]